MREGEVYSISEAIVTGDTVIPVEEMERLVLVRPGMTFSRRLLEITADNMMALLGNIGYAFANVTPVPEVDREGRTVKINFFVEPGKRVQVRQVQFKGNTRTADEVLRREMRQFEGSWYSQAAIDRSKIRLTGWAFSDGKSSGVPASTTVDVIFNVTETTSAARRRLGYSQLAV